MQISNFYMIGDNPRSDIEGANKKGWISILVKTGVFDPNAATSENGNDRENPASYVVADMQAAVELVFELEKLPKFTI
jgi:ribonucleotide monophosphatase NagD (HAD superfamily)